MPTVLLVRHGRTTANASGVLAGRMPGVHLDEVGRRQVAATGERIAAAPIARVVSSPLERCRETADAILAAQEVAPALAIEPGLSECDYGDWQGRPLAELAREDLWKVVQSTPSAATFPAGESMLAMHARGVEAVRRIDAEVLADHGPDAVWVAVSHGDVLKAILADALGMHLDHFQRLHVDPASVSIVRYGTGRPQVLGSNTHAGDLSWLRPRVEDAASAASDDAVVGGGAGPRS
ncbi:MSMEG_4193 family putative phosphomutase [Agrococcus jejuensis]|uniref:Probable phosphomutase, MSMEG_4193 family n=1 Tax=Agrococcus jejuensis TaxID=399736 RepID=A0A1G8AVN7_9MICO|nr:MSMEG_4193 family putative phosphomutase [Agrococcus jejuensis]SDH24998.1 probable phosphomutase, MSMEG_4193 family [Agrococcus jejuensis]